jgi:proteasome lid subunit RPN8/RPN11
MVLHCLEQRPYEACGLFSGREGRLETIWRMVNVDRSPVSFSMDVEEIGKVFQAMKDRGEELTGIYHSHPTAPAIPSPEDIAFSCYPTAAYIIVSLENVPPSYGCYRIDGQNAAPIRVAFY